MSINKVFIITFILSIIFICYSCIFTSKNILKSTPEIQRSGGFADLNGGTSGGQRGKEITVTSANAFKSVAAGNTPKIIYLSGYIELDKGKYTSVGSNKTIIGINNAKIRYGGLLLERAKNIIIKNIEFCDAVTPGSGTELDCISIIEGTKNVWIDHCTFSDDPEIDLDPAKHHDGTIDIKKGSNYITVSYCEFHNHDKTCLLGHSDGNGSQDRNKLKATYHHNFFNGTVQRHPRVRFGECHVYNNYYLLNTGYGIGCGYEAKIYSENNYFENVNVPFKYYNAKNAVLIDVGSKYIDSGSPKTQEGTIWNPKDTYAYEIDPAENVKEICLTYSGAGKPNRE